MSEIYANCVLNISVDHGTNAEAGCFVSRDPDTVKPCIVQLKLPTRDEKKGKHAYVLERRDLLAKLHGETPCQKEDGSIRNVFFHHEFSILVASNSRI